MASTRATRQVRKLIDRASLIAAALIGLLLVWATGTPLLPVAVFLIGSVITYGFFQYLAQKLLGTKTRRRTARR